MALDDFRRTDLIIDKATQRIDWQAPLRAVQGEYNGRSLRVQLTNNGVVEPQTATLLFGFHCTANHKEGIYDMTVVDAEKGLYEVFYPSEMLEKAGTVACTIKIIENTGSDGDESHISILDGISVEVAYNPVSGTAEVAENSIRVFDKALIDIAAHERRILIMEMNFSELAEMLTLNIPNMDVAVSTRAPADTALSREVWTDERAEKLDTLDHWTDQLAKNILIRTSPKTIRQYYASDSNGERPDITSSEYTEIINVTGMGSLTGFYFRMRDNSLFKIKLTVDDTVILNVGLKRQISLGVSNPERYAPKESNQIGFNDQYRLLEGGGIDTGSSSKEIGYYVDNGEELLFYKNLKVEMQGSPYNSGLITVIDYEVV